MRAELTNESLYNASISSMRLKLQKLEEIDADPQKLRQHPEGYKEINRVFHYQSLSFVPEPIKIKIINCHHNDFLAGYFSIKRTRKLVAYKYY